MATTARYSLQPSSLGRMPPVGLVGAEEVLRMEVVDRDGSRIGELRDLLLDLRRSRVAYGLVAIDHGRGERLVAVPWNAMYIDGDGSLKVNARREGVEAAPSPEVGPALLDHEWAVLIHSYFGTRPYWEHNAQHG